MAKVDSSVHVWAPHLVLTVLSLLRDRHEFGCLKVTSNYSFRICTYEMKVSRCLGQQGELREKILVSEVLKRSPDPRDVVLPWEW